MTEFIGCAVWVCFGMDGWIVSTPIALVNRL